jgi:hypothetical protein
VAFAQRLLQRRVQFRRVDVAVVQVAVDEVGVDLDHLLDQRAVRGVDRAEVAVAFAVVEAVDHLGAARIGQVQGRHSLPKVAWICASSPGRSTPGASILLTMMMRSRWRDGRVLHHAHGHRLDAVDRADHHRRGLHRFQRRQALAQEVGRARGVDEMHARVAVVQVQHRGVERMLHALSSGSKSLTVPPLSSAPGVAIMPARCSSASARQVLPAAAAPTSASVRMRATASAPLRAPLAAPLGAGLGMVCLLCGVQSPLRSDCTRAPPAAASAGAC